jgi:hypothetical protein
MKMTAEAFLNHLYKAMPTVETLKSYGLSKDEVEEVQSTFIAISKGKLLNQEKKSELKKMITHFNCSNIQIGLITFRKSLLAHSYGTFFAMCEADSLVILSNESIVLLDHENENHKPIKCAIDSEHFLRALAIFIDIRKNKMSWQGKSKEASTLCANAAGGIVYEDFFNLLCAFL